MCRVGRDQPQQRNGASVVWRSHLGSEKGRSDARARGIGFKSPAPPNCVPSARSGNWTFRNGRCSVRNIPEVWKFNMFRTEHLWRLDILSCGFRLPGRLFHAAAAVMRFFRIGGAWPVANIGGAMRAFSTLGSWRAGTSQKWTRVWTMNRVVPWLRALVANAPQCGQ